MYFAPIKTGTGFLVNPLPPHSDCSWKKVTWPEAFSKVQHIFPHCYNLSLSRSVSLSLLRVWASALSVSSSTSCAPDGPSSLTTTERGECQKLRHQLVTYFVQKKLSAKMRHDDAFPDLFGKSSLPRLHPLVTARHDTSLRSSRAFCLRQTGFGAWMLSLVSCMGRPACLISASSFYWGIALIKDSIQTATAGGAIASPNTSLICAPLSDPVEKEAGNPSIRPCSSGTAMRSESKM